MLRAPVARSREWRQANAPLYIAPKIPMLAGFLHGIGGFCDACVISIGGSDPRKGTPHEISNSLSHDTD
jgi:hypothetical protein